MHKNIALIVAGIIFILMALVHLLRLVQHVAISVGGYIFPQYLSIVGLIILVILAIWMFYSASR